MKRDTYTMTLNGETYLQWNCTEQQARHYFDLNCKVGQITTLVAPSGATLASWTPFRGHA